MKFRSIIVICVLLLLLMTANRGSCQSVVDYTVDYTVQINSDNSAVWTITQATNITAPTDDVNNFQQKVISLVDLARNETHREMAVDETSLRTTTDILWETQSKTVKYTFRWENFSITTSNRILFGDVFRVNTFFSLLYGDGELQINYPSSYEVESISPSPNNQNSTFQTFSWYRTQDFITGTPNITLKPVALSSNDNGWEQYAIIAVGSAAVIAGAMVGFYVFRRRNRKEKDNHKNLVSTVSLMANGEEEIINVLQSSGGSQRQSVIVAQCRFSKAKTSQLLAALEQKGVVRRYKKGRDKIVTLNEKSDR